MEPGAANVVRRASLLLLIRVAAVGTLSLDAVLPAVLVASAAALAATCCAALAAVVPAVLEGQASQRAAASTAAIFAMSANGVLTAGLDAAATAAEIVVDTLAVAVTSGGPGGGRDRETAVPAVTTLGAVPPATGGDAGVTVIDMAQVFGAHAAAALAVLT